MLAREQTVRPPNEHIKIALAERGQRNTIKEMCTMIKKLVAGTLVAAVAFSCLLAPGAVFASAGDGPFEAAAASGTWTELQQGATTWYGFTYAGDSSQILVTLDQASDNSAGFAIWTPEEVDAWARGQAVEPIGRGSPNPFVANQLLWSGNFNMAGEYFVVVQSTGPGVGYYALNIAGSGVSVAAEATQATVTTAAETTSQPAVAAAAEKSTDGATPGESFTIPAYSVAAAPNATVWHSFSYAGDESRILVWLDDLSGVNLTLSVWTPEQVAQMEKGNTVEPVGRGSYDQYGKGSLSWAGNFPQAGTYYVTVDNGGAAVGSYTLQIAGSGVW
jgi:hypothetical protein